MFLNKKKILLILFAIVLIAALTWSGFVAWDVLKIPDKLLFSSEITKTEALVQSSYQMQMDEGTGYFSILDTRNNTVYTSYPRQVEEDESMKAASKNRIRSMLEITVLDNVAKTITTVNSTKNSISNGGLSVEPVTNGYQLTYLFQDEKISIPLLVRITEHGFKISLDPSTIKELGNIKIMDIRILPFFMASDGKSQGYFMIPDGSGALIDYQNKKPQTLTYAGKIFSSDASLSKESDVIVTQGIRLPVFGAKTKDAIMLGIVTKGAADAYIVANTDEDKSNYVNVCTQFTLRVKDKIVYDDNRATIDLYQKTPIYLNEAEVEYYLQNGENLTYVDMAGIYRSYLFDTYKMKKSTGEKELPLFLDLYGATIKKKQYAGVPIESGQTLTTYDQAGEILNSLHEAGVSELKLQYFNWSEETAWGKTPRKFDVMSSLGGNTGIKEFVETTKDNGYDLYGNVNITTYYKGSNFISELYEAAKNMRKVPILISQYKPNTYVEDSSKSTQSVLTNSRVKPYIDEYVQSIAAYGFGLGVKGQDVLYRDFKNQNTALTVTLKSIILGLDSYRAKKVPLISNEGQSYTLPYSSAIFNTPSSDSDFDLSDGGIPFYQIVLHGVIPYSLEPINSVSDPTVLYLKSLETGASPYYKWTYASSDAVRNSRNSDLYYSHYAAWLEDAVQKYKEMNSILKGKANQYITKHQKLSEEVFATTYEDGDQIIVNYGANPYQSDAGTIISKSYLLVKGGNN